MKIIYLSHSELEGWKSDHRATSQKLMALKELVEELIVVSSKFKKFKFLEIIFLELKCIFLMMQHKPNVLISRGYVGFFSQKYAKLKKIKTVREVHADIIEEVHQYDKNFLEKKLLLPLAYYMQTIDKQSDIRIFNHPNLLLWFSKKFQNVECKNDIFVYNGFDSSEKSTLTQLEAKEKFNFKNNVKYLVFTGGVKYWHGINYLADLQKEFIAINAQIQIVCGGGKISRKDDPEGYLVNITPLDSKNCMDLIQASDACILSVRQSRVSPGSALKLYDYFLHKKFVITQKKLKGYSDEVLEYGYGTLIDFKESNLSAKKILDIMNRLKVLNNKKIIIEKFSWRSRMSQWIKCLNSQ